MVGADSLNTLMNSYVIPTDQRSAVAVQALDMLAEQSPDPSTAFFAAMFALDMCAQDTDFDEVLAGCSKRAQLIAAALDRYVVRDPLLRDDALDAQEALAAELPGYKTQWCEYKPPSG